MRLMKLLCVIFQMDSRCNCVRLLSDVWNTQLLGAKAFCWV